MEQCEQLELDLVFEKIEQETPKNKTYDLQIVYADGRFSRPIYEYSNLNKIKAVADILYEQGGYVLIGSIYKLGGYSPARIRTIEYFKGSEHVFEVRYGNSLERLKKDIKLANKQSKKSLKNYLRDLKKDGLLNEWLQMQGYNFKD